MATLFVSLVVFSLQLLCLPQTSLSFDVHNNNTLCPHHQKVALLQLKHGSLIRRGLYNSSSRLDSWNLATDCCSWEGITCDVTTGHIIELDLSTSDAMIVSWIEGQIDSSLFQLQSLQKLNLAWNFYYPNPIPSRLGQLTNLTHLNLSNCDFKGQIPMELSHLTKLVSLDLSSQYFRALLHLKNQSLTTLIQNFFNLEELFLGYVNISEHEGEWTHTLSSRLPNLHKLSLRGCGLGGQIPLELSKLTKLISLDLSENYALEIKNPNLATPFANLFNLEDLSLDGVNISEHHPGEWALVLSSTLPNLRSLSLRSCGLSTPDNLSLFHPPFISQLSLDGNNFSSYTELTFLHNFSSLTSLSLRDCGLRGIFPKSIFLLPNLKTLDISNNSFDLVEFPKSSSVQQLYMDNMFFQEKFPNSIINFKFIKELSLSYCNLSGSLPSSIANLTHLEFLDLSSNDFRGTIPQSLFAHPSLQIIRLGWNQFSGPLDGFQNASSSLIRINLRMNKLQGPIPKSIFKLVKLENLDLSSNNFSGTIELSDMLQSFRRIRYLRLSNSGLSVINAKASSNLILSSPIVILRLCSCRLFEFPNILKNLNHLNYLDLSDNKIHGEIPSWIWRIGNWSLSSLNLSHNFLESFEHPLPNFSFSRLYYIDLHSNRLQGFLPIMPAMFQDYSKNNFSFIMPHKINFSSFVFFSASDNNINGEIPPTICDAHDLEFLDLSNNNFSGNIPKCLVEISGSLKILNLKENFFTGMIPQSFGNTCNLRTLNVQENQLRGPLPRSLANCKMLEVLDVGNNQLNGIFPFWLGNLSNLHIFILRSNKFHGPIAQSHVSYPLFPLLQIFDISSNSFEGSFPSKLFSHWKVMMGDTSLLDSNDQIVRYQTTNGIYYQDSVTITMKGLELEVTKILTVFSTVDLSNNRFEGRIAESIGNLNLLHVLNLSQNTFCGPIPTSLENLRELESLDLSKNKFTGEIPMQLSKLTFLEVLNVSQNLLVGSIPQGPQFLTFTNASFLGNKDLCGPPLSRKCEDSEVLSSSNFENSGLVIVEEIDWRVMWMGFGVGFGVGFGLVIWTLVLWKKGSRRCMLFVDGAINKLFR